MRANDNNNKKGNSNSCGNNEDKMLTSLVLMTPEMPVLTLATHDVIGVSDVICRS